MLKTVICLILVAVGFHYFLAIRKGWSIGKEFMYKHAPGPCRQIYKEGGAEDMTHIGDGYVIVSSGVNMDGIKGNLKLLDLNLAEPGIYTLKVINPPSSRPDFMAGSHGLSFWRDPKTGIIRLYVITHPPTEDVVEVFELQSDYRSIKHVRSISNPDFGMMNDLAVVGKDQFYITRMMRSRQPWGWLVELFMVTMGKVYYYDGTSLIMAASGMYMPNGINVSPDKKTVYVAEVGKQTLRAFTRNQDNTLTDRWAKYMDSGIDNIEVDPTTGYLMMGSHPLYYMTFDIYNYYQYTLPGQVLKVKLDQSGEVSDIIEVYADDGSETSFTAIATEVKTDKYHRLAIGSVIHQLTVCEVKYIK